MGYMSVQDAADVIGVTDRRIRAMIADGVLGAERVGDRWLLNNSEVDRLHATRRQPGRPYSPPHAWGLLAIAGGRPTPWLSGSENARLAGILESSSIEALAPSLRRRAESHHWYVHPGVLTDFVADRHTVVGGPGAAHGLRYGGPEHLYVPADSVDALRSEYRPLVDAENSNTIMRIVHSAWPFLEGEQEAWPIVVAVDLLDHPLDVRAQRVAREILEGSDA
ncbi:MAG: excisionase family DNA-binding protein [Actinomycetota bacterium]